MFNNFWLALEWYTHMLWLALHVFNSLHLNNFQPYKEWYFKQASKQTRNLFHCWPHMVGLVKADPNYYVVLIPSQHGVHSFAINTTTDMIMYTKLCSHCSITRVIILKWSDICQSIVRIGLTFYILIWHNNVLSFTGVTAVWTYNVAKHMQSYPRKLFCTF